MDISEIELTAARSLSVEERYAKGEVRKKDGSARFVYNPHHLIRKIQRRINRRIFSNSNVISWPDHIFGSVPNTEDEDESLNLAKDYVSCARQHCGSKSILSVDVKDFFNNIHQEKVFDIFSKFLQYPAEVSEALADVCCRDGNVVQGALTSSYIASLCLYQVEGDIVKRLSHKGLVYTRLVDDITISSKTYLYDFDHTLGQVRRMLEDSDLPINLEKTKIQYASTQPLLVHGLRVDFPEPRLPPDEPKRIRAAVKNLELLAATPGYRASRSYRKDFNRCMGRVNKLQRVKHSQHQYLVARLQKILPLPSHKDIERAELLVARLEKDFQKPNYSISYWFYRRYHVASERLSILNRSFQVKAGELRKRLQKIKPLHKRYD